MIFDKKVVSLDPGVTTGYTINYLLTGKPLMVHVGQAKMKHLDLWYWLNNNDPDIIVYETFDYRNDSRKGLELYSRELIGIILLYEQERSQLVVDGHSVKKVELVAQQPAVVGGYFTDHRLKEDKLWWPGHPHAMDALRHVLQWYTFGSGYKYNQHGYEKGEAYV